MKWVLDIPIEIRSEILDALYDIGEIDSPIEIYNNVVNDNTSSAEDQLFVMDKLIRAGRKEGLYQCCTKIVLDENNDFDSRIRAVENLQELGYIKEYIELFFHVIGLVNKETNYGIENIVIKENKFYGIERQILTQLIFILKSMGDNYAIRSSIINFLEKLGDFDEEIFGDLVTMCQDKNIEYSIRFMTNRMLEKILVDKTVSN